jgi:hypothetical protein
MQATRDRFPAEANLMYNLRGDLRIEMTQVKSLYSGDPDVMCMTVGAIQVKVKAFSL